MKNQLKSYIEKLGALKNNRIFMICGIMIVIITIALLIYQNTFSYELYLNDEKIGIVEKKTIVEDALAAVEKQVTDKYGDEATYKIDTKLEKTRVHKDQLTGQDQLQTLIYDNIEVYKTAAVIVVDGEEILALETKEEAESILEGIKEPFVEKVMNKKENADVLDNSFSQKVETIIKEVPVDEIYSQESALKKIEENKEQVQTYKVVSGDNAWNVSRAFKTELNTLEEANPDKDIQDLHPGEIINLVVEKSFVDVATTIKQRVKEEISYEVVKEKTSSLYTGESKVKQNGKKGQKEVTKEITYINGVQDHVKVIEEKVVTEPTKKIVLVGTKSRPASTSSKSAAPTYNGDVGSAIVATAKHYIGTPYRSGGSSPSGFDCSGFTSYVYKQYGINLPRTSGGQGGAGGYVSRSNLRPGDLVVFSGHVGIYVGNNSFIHSPRPGKSVQISSLNESYWRSTYRSGRRVY
ncbi:MAG: NlpC/P60 family protein [Eubacteriales bacterium]